MNVPYSMLYMQMYYEMCENMIRYVSAFAFNFDF